MIYKKGELTPLGKAIKKGMIDMGLSHSDLATAVGTSLAYLGHIMYGRKSGEKYVNKIADMLNFDVNQFIG